MTPAPLHPQEEKRLAALRRLDILDTDPEPAFERVTRISQRLFEAPISLVSLVDRDRQWFKSRRGLSVSETPRDASFCAHAILGDGVMVVPDATQDPRFADNSLVVGDPDIRFYAGAPLRNPDGLPVGTLCVIDTKPRDWSPEDSAALADLATVVEHELVHRRAVGEHQALLTLTAVTALDESDQQTLLHRALTIGCEHLELPIGVVSRIVGERYEILAQVSPATMVNDRLVFALRETYCQMAIDAGDLIAVAHMGESNRASDPCYAATGMEAYIGVPLVVGDEIFGTLSFSGPEPHRSPTFASDEVDFVRLLGRWLEGVIARKLQSDRLNEQRRLLRAITVSQSTFIQNVDRRRAFEGLLDDVLKLTGCEYGFIGEVLHDEEGAPYLKTRALTNIAWNEATARLYQEQHEAGLEFRNLDTLFGRTLTSGEPVIANNPYDDPRRGGLPAEHPPMTSYLGLPLHIGDHFVGMLGLANHAGGFDESWVETLEPLSATIAQLIEAHRTQVERREDQAAIARLSQVASQMTNAIVITDLDGCIEWTNDAFTRLFGYHLDDVAGLRPRDVLLGPMSDPLASLTTYRAMERQEPFSIEQTVADRLGKAKWVEVTGTPLLDPDGAVAGYIVVITDISERKRVERMKTEFISTISHELRTPLTSIAGSLGLVAGGVAGPLPERAQRMVAIAQKNSERLSTLINDLLDLEKLVDGGLPILAEPHHVMPIVEQAIRDNEGYAATYRTHFVIGSAAEGAQIMVDSFRMVQVLSNLLSNAAKFSPEGADVRIDIESAEGTVRISVADSGPGIDLAFQDRIFEKFSQADGSDARSRGGSGLGLAISKELMERMRGTIGFDSEPGAGSVFYVTLPLHDPSTPSPESLVVHG